MCDSTTLASAANVNANGIDTEEERKKRQEKLTQEMMRCPTGVSNVVTLLWLD